MDPWPRPPAGFATTAQAAASYKFTHVDTDKCMSVSGGGSAAEGAELWEPV